jgi:hypothetical protein
MEGVEDAYTLLLLGDAGGGRGGRAPAGSVALRLWSLVGARTPFPGAAAAAAAPRAKVGKTSDAGRLRFEKENGTVEKARAKRAALLSFSEGCLVLSFNTD